MKEQPSYPGPTEGVGFVPSSLRPPTDVPVFPENGTACDKLYSLKQPRDSLADFPSSPIAQLRSTNVCQAKPSQGIQMVTPLPSPPGRSWHSCRNSSPRSWLGVTSLSGGNHPEAPGRAPDGGRRDLGIHRTARQLDHS